MNLGSLPIDHVLSLRDIVGAVETIASDAYHLYYDGKGCNQSLALARVAS